MDLREEMARKLLAVFEGPPTDEERVLPEDWQGYLPAVDAVLELLPAGSNAEVYLRAKLREMEQTCKNLEADLQSEATARRAAEQRALDLQGDVNLLRGSAGLT